MANPPLNFSTVRFHPLRAEGLPVVTIGKHRYLVVPVNLDSSTGLGDGRVTVHAGRRSRNQPLNVAVSFNGKPTDYVSVENAGAPTQTERATLMANAKIIGQQMQPPEPYEVRDAGDLLMIRPTGWPRVQCVGLLVKMQPD